jgi:hypothetical protein
MRANRGRGKRIRSNGKETFDTEFTEATQRSRRSLTKASFVVVTANRAGEPRLGCRPPHFSLLASHSGLRAPSMARSCGEDTPVPAYRGLEPLGVSAPSTFGNLDPRAWRRACLARYRRVSTPRAWQPVMSPISRYER